MDMERRFRQLQRATVARSALDVIALIFLFAGFAFWAVAFWQLLTPPALLSLLSIQAAVLALVFSLAAPLLLSMLVPTTPAGQMLQKTQHATIGFWVVLGCAGFLTYQCFSLIAAWLSAQGGIDPASQKPVLQAAGQVTPLATALTIAFVVIPALAWVQLTPERWLAQIQQAHQVKKLEMQQRGELAIIRAMLIKAEQRALIGFVNMLPLEKEEHFATIRGLIMGINDQQHAIARTMGVSAELERTMMGDSDIATALDSVKLALEESELRIIDAPADIPAETSDTRALAHTPDRAPSPPERAERAPAGHTEPHSGTAPTRVAVRQGNARHDESYTLAYDQLSGRAWTVRELGELLDVAESTARDIRIRWTQAGLVTGEGLPNGRYNFTERGGA
jgi:hypothetical protein